MAAVTDAQTSATTQLIINQVSQMDCGGKEDEKMIFRAYLQQLKKQYNKKMLRKYLTQVVECVDDMYYNDGTSPWSDCQYDYFIETIENDFNKYVGGEDGNKVGAAVHHATAVKLPYFMGSMNKYKSIGEIQNWCRKFRSPYTITAKLDGVSAMYYRGKLYTRGNGTSGRDISYLIPFLSQKMPGADYDFGLRGELIIRKSVFANKYSGSFANSRNLVCGLLNRVYCEENEEFYRNIDFIVYDVYYHNPLQFCNKVNIIKESGCQMVVYDDKIAHVSMNDLKLVDAVLKRWKAEYDYEIDGIIVTTDKPCVHSNDSNPDFAFAYKNNVIGVEMKEAIVECVLWNVSKDSYLKPKIKLTERVVCDGSQIEYVTGFNAKYILQNDIKYGTVVKIGLSGNVIPHIFDILGGSGEVGHETLAASVWHDLAHPTTQKLLENIGCDPGSYLWNKNKVDLVSTNNETPACIIKKNMVFFNSFEIKCGLQETTLLNLFKSLGVYKLEGVLSLSLEQWEQVEKVGTKKGSKIVEALKRGLDWNLVQEGAPTNLAHVSEEYFMKWLLGLQSFPRGFGKKKLDSHIRFIKSVCHTDFSKLYNLDHFKSLQKTLVGKVEEYKTPQVTSDSIELFCEGFSRFIEEYGNIKTNVTNIELPTLETLLLNTTEGLMAPNDGPIHATKNGGKGNVVFSGIRDKAKESYYLKQGYEISDTVNSDTKLLIVKDKLTKTTKIKRALALGIRISSLNEL